MKEYEEMIEHYKVTASKFTHKERAEFEKQIWDTAAPSLDLGGMLRRTWLASQIFESQSDIENRSIIYNGGLAADELWRRLDEGMPLTTATGLLRKAKKIANASRIALRDALKSELDDYDKLPMYRLANGKVTRRRAPATLPNLKDIMPPKKRGRPSSGHPRVFWAHIRDQLAHFVAARLVGADPIVAQTLWKDFEKDLKIIFDELQSKLYRARRDDKKGKDLSKEVSRRAVVNACHTLSMDPPSPGKAIDLTLAKKQKHKLARLYHPDRHNGDESTRPQYDAVLEAFLILEQYQGNFGANNPSDEPKQAGGIGG